MFTSNCLYDINIKYLKTIKKKDLKNPASEMVCGGIQDRKRELMWKKKNQDLLHISVQRSLK